MILVVYFPHLILKMHLIKDNDCIILLIIFNNKTFKIRNNQYYKKIYKKIYKKTYNKIYNKIHNVMIYKKIN